MKQNHKATPSLADDVFASLNEALKYARGEEADVIVHRVKPRDTDARVAPMSDYSRRDFVRQ